VIGALFLILGVGAFLWIFFGTAVFPFHYGFFFVGPLFGLIFILFLVFLGLRFLLWPIGYRRYGRAWRYDPAMDTLRQRYARGEITKEQFDQMTRDLEQNRFQRRL